MFAGQLLYVVAGLSLLVVMLLIVRYIRLQNADARSPIDIRDLLMHDGKLSSEKCVLAVALIVTSWSFIYQTLAGKMTDAMYLGYGALWITPLVARNLKADPAPSPTE